MLPLDYGPSSDPHDGPGPPLVETVWVEPYPDGALRDERAAPDARYEQRESVELAFVAALQHLPPRQRAVLILREVLGFSAREVADSLESTVASVNSALQRARAAVEERAPEQSQQATLRALGDDELQELVSTYVDAWERGDVDAIAAMLADEATLTMPPMATWYRGPDVLVFLRDWAFSGRAYGAEGNRRVRVIPTRANGQPAFGTYSWDPERARAPAHRPAGAHAARRADRGDHRLREPGDLPGLRAAGRAALTRAARTPRITPGAVLGWSAPYLMNRISEYLGSGQRSSATIFSRRSPSSRTAASAVS